MSSMMLKSAALVHRGCLVHDYVENQELFLTHCFEKCVWCSDTGDVRVSLQLHNIGTVENLTLRFCVDVFWWRQRDDESDVSLPQGIWEPTRNYSRNNYFPLQNIVPNLQCTAPVFVQNWAHSNLLFSFLTWKFVRETESVRATQASA